MDYAYDSRNRLTQTASFDYGTAVSYTQYYYDKAGNLLRQYTGQTSPGSPPKKVLDSLKKQKKWDWNQKDKDWRSKIEQSVDPSGYHYIEYPNGRRVTIYLPNSRYSPSPQDLRNYYAGDTFIDLSGGRSITSPVIPFLPIPNSVPLPVPAAMPIPVFP